MCPQLLSPVSQVLPSHAMTQGWLQLELGRDYGVDKSNPHQGLSGRPLACEAGTGLWWETRLLPAGLRPGCLSRLLQRARPTAQPPSRGAAGGGGASPSPTRVGRGMVPSREPLSPRDHAGSPATGGSSSSASGRCGAAEMLPSTRWEWRSVTTAARLRR